MGIYMMPPSLDSCVAHLMFDLSHSYYAFSEEKKKFIILNFTTMESGLHIWIINV